MHAWMGGWMVTDKPEGGFGDLKNTVMGVNYTIVRDLRLIQRYC